MSDNVSELGEKKPKKLIKRILLMLLLIVLVCGIAALVVFRDSLNLDAARRFVRYLNVSGTDTKGKYSFDAHSGNQYASYENGLALASVAGLSTYLEGGTEDVTVQVQLTTPALRVGGELAMAFDAGGYNLTAASHAAGQVLNVTSEKPILDADISPDDCICYAAPTDGYKTVLCVYNKDQTLVYRWLSSSQYLPVCAISEGAGSLAAVAMGQTDGIYKSTLEVFKTDSDKICKEIPLGNDLVYDLSFEDPSTLLAVGETDAKWLTADGTALGTYSYDGAYLQDYDLGGSGFLTLNLNMYKAGNRCSVKTVGPDGKELGSIGVDEEILDLSAAGKYVAVLTASGLSIYDETMKLYASTKDTNAATSVVMRQDGSAILLANGEGQLYVP
jgi:hypothetical protein